MSKQDHDVIAFEGYFLDEGRRIVCSCGWRSELGSKEQTEIWHRNHVYTSIPKGKEVVQ